MLWYANIYNWRSIVGPKIFEYKFFVLLVLPSAWFFRFDTNFCGQQNLWNDYILMFVSSILCQKYVSANSYWIFLTCGRFLSVKKKVNKGTTPIEENFEKVLDILVEHPQFVKNLQTSVFYAFRWYWFYAPLNLLSR